MAEETEEKTKKKLESRKFVIWLVWCILTVAIVVYSVAVIIITKEFTDTVSTMIEKVLGWFFGVSMLYIGANAGQKVGLGFADAMNKKEGDEE